MRRKEDKEWALIYIMATINSLLFLIKLWA